MKKVISLFLAVLMLLELTACGKGMPKFDSTKLTTAQEYVYAAMQQYSILKTKEFKAARVLLGEDMKAVLDEVVPVQTWDVTNVKALVLIYIGSKTDTSASTGDATSTGNKDQGKDKEKVEYNAFNPDPKWGWMYYAMDADKKIVYKWLADEDVATAANGGQTRADKLPAEIAKAELDMEAYATQYSGQLGDYVATIENRIKEDPEYFYTMKLWEDVGANTYKQTYAQKRKEVQTLRHEAEYYKTHTLSAHQSAWSSLKSLKNQKYTLNKELYAVQQKLAKLESSNAAAIKEFLTKTESMRSQGDYFFNLDYVRIAITNDIYNNYDNYTRQIKVYEQSIAAVDKAYAERKVISDGTSNVTDAGAANYILDRCEEETETFAEASNAFKVHAQCLNNQEQFKFKNADTIAAYEAASKAAKDKAGANYEKDVDYLKVEMTYQNLTKQLKAHESAVTASKADYEKINTNSKKALDEMDAKEKERLVGVAITKEQQAVYDWAMKQTEYKHEYEVENGQWGALHPDYAAYQNKNLKYYVSNSGGNGFGCVFIYDDGHVCRRPVVKGKIYCKQHL